MLVVKGDAGEVVMFHGDYSPVTAGDTVVGGKTVVGREATIGNSTGCHNHIVWRPNPSWVPPLYTVKTNDGSRSITHTNLRGIYGSVLDDYTDVSISLSHYKPSEGGTNGSGDYNIMASGDTVAEWLLGKNGVMAIACPQEFPYGTRINIEGQVFECRDHGGYINAYTIGDYDPAYKRITAHEHFWVDVLGAEIGGYGQMTDNWYFEQ
jgi:hypothetical protein